MRRASGAAQRGSDGRRFKDGGGEGPMWKQIQAKGWQELTEPMAIELVSSYTRSCTLALIVYRAARKAVIPVAVRSSLNAPNDR